MKISAFFTLSDFSISFLWQHNFLLLVFAFENYWAMFVAGSVRPNVFCLKPKFVSSDSSRKSSVVHSTFQLNSFSFEMCLEYPLWVYHNVVLCVSNEKSSTKRWESDIGTALIEKTWMTLNDNHHIWNTCSMSKGAVYALRSLFPTLIMEEVLSSPFADYETEA